MSITHYDLFAGIGGFSLALEEVFTHETIKHVFCEWESFPTAVLKKHWPDGEYYGDIADLVADTDNSRSRTPENTGDTERSSGNERRQEQLQHRTDGHDSDAANAERTGLEGRRERQGTGHGRFSSGTGGDQTQKWSIITGGFPCQPFSHAGRRRGTADDRYQWPNMFAVIRNIKPEWVVAENVRGLVTWNDGMVLEQVCTDLESEGYEVQPFIIPAVAVNAPHRRDRVWIIANCAGKRSAGQRLPVQPRRPQQTRAYPDWSRNWQEVAFATCDDTMDDGLPRFVDGVPYSRAKWRKNSLKAYGNGIVHQVATEIMKAIKEARS